MHEALPHPLQMPILHKDPLHTPFLMNLCTRHFHTPCTHLFCTRGSLPHCTCPFCTRPPCTRSSHTPCICPFCTRTPCTPPLCTMPPCTPPFPLHTPAPGGRPVLGPAAPPRDVIAGGRGVGRARGSVAAGSGHRERAAPGPAGSTGDRRGSAGICRRLLAGESRGLTGQQRGSPPRPAGGSAPPGKSLRRRREGGGGGVLRVWACNGGGCATEGVCKGVGERAAP